MSILRQPVADSFAEGNMHSSGEPRVTITPSLRTWREMLGSLWARQEIVAYLAYRDIRARYHQTILGVFWALMQPLATTLVFTIVFGKVAKIPMEGVDVPYPLFLITGLLPWQFLATAIQRSSTSLLANNAMIKKVYFPRLAVPLAAVVGGLVEFMAAGVVLAGMMIYYGVRPSASLLLLPVVMVLAGVVILGVGLILASLNCRFRDVSHGVAFGMQMWMYLTPIVYPFALVPERFGGWMLCNPMTGLIGGFRSAFLGTARMPLDWTALALSAVVGGLLLTIGGAAFRRVERGAADVL
jgi:lipopolysaccharide transport system permease protein